MSVAPGTAELVRRANLARMLVAVHRHGPLSRAALTAELGLNRSTIGALTAELSRLGLVAETAGAAEGRIGRPSPMVAARPGVTAIAVNPEVDAVTIAAVGLDRRVHARRREVTTTLISPEGLAELVAATISGWRGDELAAASVVGVGIAVPGLVQPADGRVVHAPHLRWTDAPVADLVTAATGIPTTVGNDASYGALAEHLFGQCRGFLRAHAIEPRVGPDTAGSAAAVAKAGDVSLAALASELAAEIHGLTVLARHIEDQSDNTTRFLVMAAEPVPVPRGDVLTTFVFRVRNLPAALYKAMGGFATNGVNMTKLESYQLNGRFVATMFYADVEGHPDDPPVARALEELGFFSTEVHILGAYPASPYRARVSAA